MLSALPGFALEALARGLQDPTHEVDEVWVGRGRLIHGPDRSQFLLTQGVSGRVSFARTSASRSLSRARSSSATTALAGHRRPGDRHPGRPALEPADADGYELGGSHLRRQGAERRADQVAKKRRS
jgi:hypothetical protein